LRLSPANLALKLVSAYQKYLRPCFPAHCRFEPGCSEYTKQAVEKYGALKGSSLGFLRILRCHPWQKNHIDPLN